MVVKFDTPKNASNTGSSSAFVKYLDKEDELKKSMGENPEQWFSYLRDECEPVEVRVSIDSDHQGVGKSEGKFATGSISPTLEEWNALGETEEERRANFKAWIKEDFSQEFAGNFNKADKSGNVVTIEPENVKMFYKIEDNRYYTGFDEEVKQNIGIKQGDPKLGFNIHCHFIVARKTEDKNNRISPTTNNKKEFSRDELTHKTERSFDHRAGYERPIEESYQYAKTMKNGTGQEKAELIEKTVKARLVLELPTPKPVLEVGQEVKEVLKQAKKTISKDFGIN